MYYTELDPFVLAPIFVEKNPVQKERQKQIATKKPVWQKGRSKKPHGKKPYISN
jgi:hypothetical protein